MNTIKEASKIVARMNTVMRHTTSFVTALTLALFILLIYEYATPAQSWLDVRSIRVSDTTTNKSPVLLVDRTINQPFFGFWTVNVLRQDQDGFTSICTAHGSNDYEPDAHLPKLIDLDWWTYPTKCILPSGQYIMRTLWTFKGFPWFDKQVRATSNIFTVT